MGNKKLVAQVVVSPRFTDAASLSNLRHTTCAKLASHDVNFGKVTIKILTGDKVMKQGQKQVAYELVRLMDWYK